MAEGDRRKAKGKKRKSEGGRWKLPLTSTASLEDLSFLFFGPTQIIFLSNQPSTSSKFLLSQAMLAFVFSSA